MPQIHHDIPLTNLQFSLTNRDHIPVIFDGVDCRFVAAHFPVNERTRRANLKLNPQFGDILKRGSRKPDEMDQPLITRIKTAASAHSSDLTIKKTITQRSIEVTATVAKASAKTAAAFWSEGLIGMAGM